MARPIKKESEQRKVIGATISPEAFKKYQEFNGNKSLIIEELILNKNGININKNTINIEYKKNYNFLVSLIEKGKLRTWELTKEEEKQLEGIEKW